MLQSEAAKVVLYLAADFPRSQKQTDRELPCMETTDLRGDNMKFRNVIVNLEKGLHDLNAAHFVQQISEFSSEIQIQHGNLVLNAKSLMGVLCMDLEPGTEIRIGARGPDAEQALDCLEEFLSQSKTDSN